jgi:WD40 repeat protein
MVTAEMFALLDRLGATEPARSARPLLDHLDGTRAVLAAWGSTLRLWDLENGDSRALVDHTNWVQTLVLLSDGRRALSGSMDNTLRLWDLAFGEKVV